jgi:hypothetical protein
MKQLILIGLIFTSCSITTEVPITESEQWSSFITLNHIVEEDSNDNSLRLAEVSGAVSEKESALPIIGAEVFLKYGDRIVLKAISDIEGKFEFKLSPGNYFIGINIHGIDTLIRETVFKPGTKNTLEYIYLRE